MLLTLVIGSSLGVVSCGGWDDSPSSVGPNWDDSPPFVAETPAEAAPTTTEAEMSLPNWDESTTTSETEIEELLAEWIALDAAVVEATITEAETATTEAETTTEVETITEAETSTEVEPTITEAETTSMVNPTTEVETTATQAETTTEVETLTEAETAAVVEDPPWKRRRLGFGNVCLNCLGEGHVSRDCHQPPRRLAICRQWLEMIRTDTVNDHSQKS